MLRSITEDFEDLRHFPPGPQVHPETRHGTPCGQANYTGAVRKRKKELLKCSIKYLSVLCLKLWIMRENVAQSTSKSVSPFVIAICDMMFWISTLLLFLLFTLNILQVSRLEKLLTKKKQAGLPAALSKVKVVSFEWIPFSQQNA